MVHIRKSVHLNRLIRPQSMDFTWLGRGAAIGPPTGEPVPTNQNGFYYRQKYSSVSSAVQVGGFRRSCRWLRLMWRSWAGVVTHGLQLWGRLDVVPNSQTTLEAAYGNSLATALVDIPAVSMPIAHSLKAWDICGIVLGDKTAHFRVAFYCSQHKVHLCNDHAV